MAERTTFSVVYNKRNSKWLVRANGSTLMWKDGKESLAYDKKEDAVEKARQAAKENRPSKLVIKNKLGGVVDSHKYN